MFILERSRQLLQRRVVKDAVCVTAGQLGSLAATIVGMRLLTEATVPAVYGVVSLVIGITNFAATLFVSPILQAATRLVVDCNDSAAEQDLRKAVHRHVRRSCVRATILGAGLGI